MELSLKDYYFVTKEISTLSPNYVKALRNLGANNYEIAFTSFLRANEHWIINKIDKKKMTIHYMNGDICTYDDFVNFNKKVRMCNEDFHKTKKSYLSRYFKVIRKLMKRKERIKDKKLEQLRSKYSYKPI